MSILEMAEELKSVLERKAKETNKSIQEVWKDSVKELYRIYKEQDSKFEDR